MSKIFTLIALISIGITSCKKDVVDDPDDPNNSDKTEYTLQIETGAKTIEPKQTINYSAVLVDSKGNITTPSNISWSISDSNVATISAGGTLATVAEGNAKITASVTVDGKEYTASVPVGIYAATLFTVAPSAIIYEKGGELQLETVYFTVGTAPTYTYSSSNTSVATVSSSGLVNFVGAGECIIKVTASTLPDRPFKIPVLVVDVPTVTLPITRVELNKSAIDLFKNETAQLSAKAYNPDGEVSGTTFTWTSSNTNIATVSTSGLVTPVRTGKTYVQATAQGIMAECEVIVNPDTVIIVTPFYKDMNPGDTYQFVAKAYKCERSGLTTEYPVTFTWTMLDYGAGFEMFNIGTVDNTGNVTIKSDATIGMSSFVLVQDQNNPYIGGAAMISISYGFPK